MVKKTTKKTVEKKVEVVEEVAEVDESQAVLAKRENSKRRKRLKKRWRPSPPRTKCKTCSKKEIKRWLTKKIRKTRGPIRFRNSTRRTRKFSRYLKTKSARKGAISIKITLTKCWRTTRTS